jgi:hypothetical protein
MVSNLQFAAVAAYLLWCLFSALTGAYGADEQEVAPDIDESDKTASVGWREGAPWGRGGREGVR